MRGVLYYYTTPLEVYLLRLCYTLFGCTVFINGRIFSLDYYTTAWRSTYWCLCFGACQNTLPLGIASFINETTNGGRERYRFEVFLLFLLCRVRISAKTFGGDQRQKRVVIRNSLFTVFLITIIRYVIFLEQTIFAHQVHFYFLLCFIQHKRRACLIVSSVYLRPST